MRNKVTIEFPDGNNNYPVVSKIACPRPRRKPDFEDSTSFRGENGPLLYWFKEMRMKTHDHHTLPLSVCPVTGLLLELNDYDTAGWYFSHKAAQEAYVSWVAEKVLLG